MARLDIQRTHDGSVEHLQLRPGENRVLVRPGQQFRLNRADVDPEQLRVLKVLLPRRPKGPARVQPPKPAASSWKATTASAAPPTVAP